MFLLVQRYILHTKDIFADQLAPDRIVEQQPWLIFIEHDLTGDEMQAALNEYRATLDPVLLLHTIREARSTLLAATAPEVRETPQTEPDATGKALMARLQTEYPDRFTDAQLRTMQRRVKEWRAIMAKKLVYATPDEALAEHDGLSEPALIGAVSRCYSFGNILR